MTPTPSNRFAAGLATFLLVEGAWGLASSVVFGVFTTNHLHAVIHLAFGAWGLVFALRDRSKQFLLTVGTVLLVVGVLFFVPQGHAVTERLAVNRAGAVLNIILGLGSLVFGARAKRS
jgi:hypothetical protein